MVDCTWQRFLLAETQSISRIVVPLSVGLVVCLGPEAQFREKLREGSGLIVGVQATGVGQNPGVAAAEQLLLDADTGALHSGHNAVGADTDEGNDGWAPAFDFGFQSLAASAQFVVGEFIGSRGGAFHNIRDPQFEVE